MGLKESNTQKICFRKMSIKWMNLIEPRNVSLPSASILFPQRHLCWKNNGCEAQLQVCRHPSDPEVSPCSSSTDRMSSHISRMFPLTSGCLLKLTYHLMFTADRKKVVSQVQKCQDATDPPNIYSRSEGEAEGHFWSSVEDEDENMRNLLWSSESPHEGLDLNRAGWTHL